MLAWISAWSGYGQAGRSVTIACPAWLAARVLAV